MAKHLKPVTRKVVGVSTRSRDLRTLEVSGTPVAVVGGGSRLSSIFTSWGSLEHDMLQDLRSSATGLDEELDWQGNTRERTVRTASTQEAAAFHAARADGGTYVVETGSGDTYWRTPVLRLIDEAGMRTVLFGPLAPASGAKVPDEVSEAV
ncbi:hypothetical protein [Lichenibacterium dinghuense]|uniref:hypothetical protein n=1 Tax=Lichenibacterium dinghuense TaxID=2895977 RepID=UPI001F1ADA54|nr:hypothetical protein [Lichenibacterium sp. 6Y81]